MGEHGKYRALVAGTLALCVVAGAARAECRLALALALDVSSSVDEHEDRLQREGLAGALLSDDVVAAALGLPESPLALAVYEWSGRYNQRVIADWRMIRGRDDLAAVAGIVAGSPRSTDQFPTAIGSALGYAAGLFRRGPDCWLRTLDVSGDGVNNEGFGPDLAYANFPLGGITVNGLVIGADPAVFEHYQTEVIRGAGSFVMQTGSYADYQDAMRRKLLRELAAQVVGTAEVRP